MTERIVYLNGAFVDEADAKVSIFDRGFNAGDGIYEATRTFAHRFFRLGAHLDRLYRSLAYVRIDCGLERAKMEAICLDLLERNRPMLGPDDEYSLWHVITRGPRPPARETGPTVAIWCMPVEFGRYARDYVEGATLVTPSTRRTPPDCLDPKAKITNKMNHIIAAFEARAADPRAIPLMLDTDGNLAETDTTNVFFVAEGRLHTPGARTVLGGITRQAIFDLAAELGVEVVEGAFTPYDLYTADEAFISGTSGSIVPVGRFNGARLGNGIPGPMTLRLMQGWIDMVGVDFVAQAIRHLGDNEAKDLLAAWQARLKA